MDFRPIAVDLDPGLSNPVVAISFAFCCTVFAGVLVFVASTQNPRRRKVRSLALTLVVGSIASKMLTHYVNWLMAWAHFARRGEYPSIGFIGKSPALWVAPSIAIGVSLVVVATIMGWRSVRERVRR